MSWQSRLVLGASVGISSGIIAYVHYKQEYDRSQMHMGVARDIERSRRRKIENTYLLQQQAELTKELQRDVAEKNRDKYENAVPS